MTKWTDQMKLAVLMTVPWTVTTQAADDPDEVVLKVREMPETIVIGSREEVEKEFWPALRASIEARLHFKDEIPLPAGVLGSLPWQTEPQPDEIALQMTESKRSIVTRNTRASPPFVETPSNELQLV